MTMSIPREFLTSLYRSPFAMNATVHLDRALEHTPAGAAIAGTILTLGSAKSLQTEFSKTSDNFRPGRVVLHLALCATGVVVTGLSVMNIFNINVSLPWPGSSTPINETFANKTLIQQTPLVLAPVEAVSDNPTVTQALKFVGETVAKPESAATFNNATMCALNAAPKVAAELPGVCLPKVVQPYCKPSDFTLELTPALTLEQRNMCGLEQPLVESVVKPVVEEAPAATGWLNALNKYRFW